MPARDPPNRRHRHAVPAAQVVQTWAGHLAGESIKLLVHRQEPDAEIPVTLVKATPSPRGAGRRMGRRPVQRSPCRFPPGPAARYAFAPQVDCGGPLVDTDGRAVGVNIARALRVTTYALPAGVVRDTISAIREKMPR